MNHIQRYSFERAKRLSSTKSLHVARLELLSMPRSTELSFICITSLSCRHDVPSFFVRNIEPWDEKKAKKEEKFYGRHRIQYFARNPRDWTRKNRVGEKGCRNEFWARARKCFNFMMFKLFLSSRFWIKVRKEKIVQWITMVETSRRLGQPFWATTPWLQIPASTITAFPWTCMSRRASPTTGDIVWSKLHIILHRKLHLQV